MPYFDFAFSALLYRFRFKKTQNDKRILRLEQEQKKTAPYRGSFDYFSLFFIY